MTDQVSELGDERRDPHMPHAIVDRMWPLRDAARPVAPGAR